MNARLLGSMMRFASFVGIMVLIIIDELLCC